MTINREKLIDTRVHCKDLKSNEFAVQALDLSGSVVDVSPAWLKLTGYEKGEVIGKHFFEFLDMETLLKVTACFPHFKDYGYVDNILLKIRLKNKTILVVSLTGTSKYNDKGKFEITYCEILPKDL
jgi:PAS domain S-box-containing protein